MASNGRALLKWFKNKRIDLICFFVCPISFLFLISHNYQIGLSKPISKQAYIPTGSAYELMLVSFAFSSIPILTFIFFLEMESFLWHIVGLMSIIPIFPLLLLQLLQSWTKFYFAVVWFIPTHSFKRLMERPITYTALYFGWAFLLKTISYYGKRFSQSSREPLSRFSAESVERLSQVERQRAMDQILTAMANYQIWEEQQTKVSMQNYNTSISRSMFDANGDTAKKRILFQAIDSARKALNRSTKRLERSSNEMCTICLDKMNAGQFVCSFPCSLTVKHRFHSRCILNWVDQGHYDCPNCRQGPSFCQ